MTGNDNAGINITFLFDKNTFPDPSMPKIVRPSLIKNMRTLGHLTPIVFYIIVSCLMLTRVNSQCSQNPIVETVFTNYQ